MPKVAITVDDDADLEGFKSAVRSLVVRQVEPNNVVWNFRNSPSFFGDCALEAGEPVRLPREVTQLIDMVICHRDPERFGLLYQMVWRILHGERQLLDMHSDPLVHRLAMMAKAVRRDLHKMHAFLRFKRIEDQAGERYLAWFEPDHYILDATSAFFAERYPSLRWSIITPIGSLHFDGDTVSHGPAGTRADVPDYDAFEAGWNVYYQSTFNPARLNVEAMRREMPRKYWRNMPETKLIPDMVRAASGRVDHMMARDPAKARKSVPDATLQSMLDGEVTTLDRLNEIIAAAEPLVPGGKVAVLGEGPLRPKIAFVGEQPGDQEDLEGRPFVGPAGQVLNSALQEAGIERDECYVTNAVKHFKHEQRGKRRIHQKPTVGEVRHYRWWLMKELQLVQPSLVVALGATAALALENAPLAVTKFRGPKLFGDQAGFITVHPSYLLRIPNEVDRKRAYQDFVGDLRQINALAVAAHAT